jgi:hypothetical protein
VKLITEDLETVCERNVASLSDLFNHEVN